jgi:mRNA turnover protein 4
MPESKRNKLVSLTQVKPKTRDHKEFVVKKVHNFMETFKYLYVLTFENMSTNNFKTLRESVTDSKFLMGKNKVIGIALGVTEENTYKPNSYKVTEVNCHPMSGSKRTLRTVLYKQNQEVS